MKEWETQFHTLIIKGGFVNKEIKCFVVSFLFLFYSVEVLKTTSVFGFISTAPCPMAKWFSRICMPCCVSVQNTN